jgi:hypothetical protein
MDLASGGFAVHLPAAVKLGQPVAFTLHVPALSGRGTQPLKGTAKVASSRAQGKMHRVSFSFDAMPAADRELLEMAIIDFVLRRFSTPA